MRGVFLLKMSLRKDKQQQQLRGEETFAIPTNLDNIRAMLHGNTRFLKEVCKDRWVVDPLHQMYPCPEGVTNCGYGHCRVASEARCEELSQVPWTPEGEELKGDTCDADHPCPAGMTCIDTTNEQGEAIHMCSISKPYLEWRNDQCVYGNFALRRWCEFPQQRRDTDIPGVTDVPPFEYHPSTGTCHMTPKYCDFFKVDWNSDKGECELSVGQWIGEFLLGKTIFREIKGVGDKFSEHFAGPGVHLYSAKGKAGVDEADLLKAYPNGGPSLDSENVVERRAAKLVWLQRYFNTHNRAAPVVCQSELNKNERQSM